MGKGMMNLRGATSQASRIVLGYEKTIAKLRLELDLEREKIQRLNELVGKSDDERVAVLQAQVRTLQQDNVIVCRENVKIQGELAQVKLDLENK